jgi:hypothetical protein
MQPRGGEALPSSAPTSPGCAAVGPPGKVAGRAEGARSGEKKEKGRERRGGGEKRGRV